MRPRQRAAAPSFTEEESRRPETRYHGGPGLHYRAPCLISGSNTRLFPGRGCMGEGTVFVGGGGNDYGEARELLLRYANRHGLIAGATGTGKTVTVQVLAEGLSAAGVPVVVQDVKGDVSGLSRPGDPAGKAHEALTGRAAQIGMADFAYRGFPVVFWDLFGEYGPSGALDGERDGAAAARADDGALRGAGGGAQHRLPRRRRAGARCSSTSRTCRRCWSGSPTTRVRSAGPTATSRRRRSARSSGRCSCSRTRAPRPSSASRRSSSPT